MHCIHFQSWIDWVLCMNIFHVPLKNEEKRRIFIRINSNLLELNCTVHFWQSNGYKVKVIGHDTVAVTLCQYDKLLLEDSSTVAWSLILVWVRNLLRLLIQMSGNHNSSKASSKSNNVLSWALDAWTRESYQLKVKYPCNVKSYDMRKLVDAKVTKSLFPPFFLIF